MSNFNVMELIPVIKYAVELPFSKELIEITPYKHGNVKGILLLAEDFKKREKGFMKRALNSMKNMVQDCVIPDVTGKRRDVRDLMIGDFVYLMNYINKVSEGDDNIFYFNCPKKCKSKKEVIFKLDECEIKNIENKLINKVTTNFPNGDEIILHVKPYTFQTLLENADFFGQEIRTGEESTAFYASFVDAIEGKGQISDNLSKDIKVKFLSALFEFNMKPLVEYIDNSPFLYWEKEVECDICGHVEKLKLKDPIDFFVLW